MQPVIFPKPPEIRTFVPEGRADKVHNLSEKIPIPEIQPLPPFEPPSEDTQVDPNTLQDLQQHKLSLPVQGVEIVNVRNSFSEMRGDRIHEAVDILAPRDTPVVAVEDGKIAKLFFSVRGGNTIYHFDASETYCYYYAHLDRYAVDIREGQFIKRGQIIGYVGTSGNAPKDTPHLHFAIFKLNSDKKWWQGTPIDPYPLLNHRDSEE